MRLGNGKILEIGGEISDQVRKEIEQVLQSHESTYATQASEIIGIFLLSFE